MTYGDLHRGTSYGEMLIRALERYPHRTAIVFEDETWTYRELAVQVSRFIQFFSEMGMGRGDGISQLSQNVPPAVGVLCAAYVMGLRFVPLHPLGSAADHAQILEDADIRTLVVEAPYFEDRGADLMRQVPGIGHAVTLGPAAYGTDLLRESATYEARPLTCPADAGDVAVLLYTGGTTGRSKGVTLTHRSMVMNAFLTLSEWEWPHDIRFLCVTPISHASGCMIVPILLRGGTVILHTGFDAQKFLAAVEKHRITATFVVPTMIYLLLEEPRAKQTDLSSLELIIYGGSAISPTKLQEALTVFGPVLMQIYSQAEVPNTAVVLRKSQHDPAVAGRLMSCGKPIAGVDVQILDDDCNPTPVGEVGEICFRSPLIMEGYWNRPDETAETLRGGWLHTGDLARRDEEGFIYIVDRKKEMIVTGGFNVFPREIEDALTSHPDVVAAAVVGVPDDKWGEAVKAVVVLKAEAGAQADDLIGWVKERKGSVAAPKSVDVVDALPTTSLGKPDKKAIRARYWTDQTRQIS